MTELESNLRIAWSPDGTRLAVGLTGSEGLGREIRIFNVSTGNREQVIKGEVLTGDKLEWSPHGNMIVAARGQTVLLWNPDTGPEKSWSLRDGYITSLAWNPDGVHLAFASSMLRGSSDNRIRVWNTQSGNIVLLDSTDERENYQLDWNPEGKRLIACHGETETIFEMWNGETGKLIQNFIGHSHGVDSMAWSVDGSRIVSGSKDSTVRMWDPKTGQETLTLTGFPSLPYIFWRPRHNSTFLTQVTFNPGYEQYLWDASAGH